jgi:hypothetical protein
VETIFTYNPTEKELEEIDLTYPGITEENYMQDLERRAKHRGSTVEYEAISDLQYLFQLRGDEQKFNHYTKILDDDFVEITNKIYNE